MSELNISPWTVLNIDDVLGNNAIIDDRYHCQNLQINLKCATATIKLCFTTWPKTIQIMFFTTCQVGLFAILPNSLTKVNYHFGQHENSKVYELWTSSDQSLSANLNVTAKINHSTAFHTRIINLHPIRTMQVDYFIQINGQKNVVDLSSDLIGLNLQQAKLTITVDVEKLAFDNIISQQLVTHYLSDDAKINQIPILNVKNADNKIQHKSLIHQFAAEHKLYLASRALSQFKIIQLLMTAHRERLFVLPIFANFYQELQAQQTLFFQTINP